MSDLAIEMVNEVARLEQENERLRTFIEELRDDTFNQSIKLLCEQALKPVQPLPPFES